jgi:SH3 domain-containing protein
MRGLLVFVGLTVMASSAWADRVPLVGEALRHELAGSLLNIDTPLGVSIAVRVSGDGLVTGEAGPLASTLGAAKDRGRWWINNDRLCVKWFRWFEAQTRCVTVEHEGPKIYWHDERGETGTATLIRSDLPTSEVASPGLVEAEQPETPSSLPPNSELPAAVMPALGGKEEMPFRFGLGMNVPLTALQKSAETDVEEIPTNTSPKLESLPKVVKPAQKPPSVKVAMKVPQPNANPTPSLRVVGVALNDALMIRSGPSEYHPSIGVIPPNATGVEIVGTCVDLWCPVRHHRTTGWVNRYYLADGNKQEQR